MAPIPTQFELRLSGYSLIITSVLCLIATWLILAGHNVDLYEITTDEQVITLHDILSSNEYRTKVEAACALLWISFPLTLATIHGIKKFAVPIFQDTPAEVLVYIGEKAYILCVGMALVFLPALGLTIVSYEWSHINYSADSTDTAPAGYWIQLYLVLFQIEVGDCLAICDATFMLSLCGTAIYFIYAVRRGHNPRIMAMDEVAHGFAMSKRVKCCCEFLVGVFFISLTVIFFFYLFEFAESGFLAPTSKIHSNILGIGSFLIKLFIGRRLIQCAQDDRYRVIKKILGDKSNDDRQQNEETEDDDREHRQLIFQ